MTSETPCLSGCRHYNLTPYKEPDHLPNCPNARKPAEPPACRFHPTGPCDPAEPQSEPPIDAEPWVKIAAQVQVGHDVIRDFDAKIDEAREQVRVLREALTVGLDAMQKNIARRNYKDEPALAAGIESARAALAATEPKG